MMKKWVISLTVVFSVGLGIDGTIREANAQYSENEADLAPLISTTWLFVYEGYFFDLKDVMFESEIITTQDGFVMLPCHNNYNASGEVKAKTEEEGEDVVYQLKVDGTSFVDTYEFTTSGNTAKGLLTMEEKATGDKISDIPVVGFKWGALICDKNNDNKLGLAEAIHYLKIATGQ